WRVLLLIFILLPPLAKSHPASGWFGATGPEAPSSLPPKATFFNADILTRESAFANTLFTRTARAGAEAAYIASAPNGA
ncbi:MAG: hypothetical protein NTX87_03425, partial [Planctomycetota bacterium]|nr:hypothetical protein [Planctomycetota bacterium]